MISSTRKYSKQRESLVALMRTTTAHPSAAWAYGKLKPAIPGLSLGTVYRNIKVAQEQGELVSVGVVGGEERFDARLDAHPHFVCDKCGAVYDLPKSFWRGARRKLQKFQNEPEQSKAFDVDFNRTVLHGLCAKCKSSREVSLT